MVEDVTIKRIWLGVLTLMLFAMALSSVLTGLASEYSNVTAVNFREDIESLQGNSTTGETPAQAIDRISKNLNSKISDAVTPAGAFTLIVTGWWDILQLAVKSSSLAIDMATDIFNSEYLGIPPYVLPVFLTMIFVTFVFIGLRAMARWREI